jgi:TPR repeat protein
MKTFLLGIVLMLTLSTQVHAQAAIAKLKYEEAEEAFASGDYATVLSKLEETEKILGEPNVKTLYLRIVAQAKLLKTEAFVDVEQVLDLRKACSNYLVKYENVEGIEEKYKEVYKISELYKSFDIPEQAFANIAKGTSSVADMEAAGDAYYFVENYRRAIELYKKAAARNSGLAMARLGDLYLSGLGVKVDSVQGNNWLDKAIAAGHPDAFHSRAFSYRYGGQGLPKDSLKALEFFKKSYEAAQPLADKGNGEFLYYAGRALLDSKTSDTLAGVELIQRAANKGYKEAQYRLGILYITGTTVDQDVAKAAQLLNKAAGKGLIAAMQRMASCYYRGVGSISQDFTKALEWFEMAAAHGDDYAAYMVGVIWAEGKGVTQDCARGITWYELAGQRGYTSGYNVTGNTYYWGSCVTKDYAKAVKYYEKAGNEGHVAAMNNAGNTYFAGGNGLTQNYAKAAEWYLKGAAKGSAWCMYNYGNMLYDGKGMTADLAKAAEWYTKSANLNNTDAMDKLYSMYYNGIGVKKDKKKAEEWQARSGALKAEHK